MAILSPTAGKLGKLDGVVFDPFGRHVRYFIVKSRRGLKSRQYWPNSGSTLRSQEILSVILSRSCESSFPAFSCRSQNPTVGEYVAALRTLVTVDFIDAAVHDPGGLCSGVGCALTREPQALRTNWSLFAAGRAHSSYASYPALSTRTANCRMLPTDLRDLVEVPSALELFADAIRFIPVKFRHSNPTIPEPDSTCLSSSSPALSIQAPEAGAADVGSQDAAVPAVAVRGDGAGVFSRRAVARLFLR
jgi:hypothetical protein